MKTLDGIDLRADSSKPSATPGRTTRVFCWLAGGEEEVFALTPSQRKWFAALGMVVCAMTFVSGVVVSIAASTWGVPLGLVPLVGATWMVVLTLVERLVLKSFSTNPLTNLAIMLPRVLLTIAATLVFTTPLGQLIFLPSINNQLSRTAVAQIKQAENAAQSSYGPKITAANKQIRFIRANENAQVSQITTDLFLGSCEAGEVACSQTHELGCGPYCQHDKQLAANAAAELRDAKPRDAQTIATLTSSIRTWNNEEKQQLSARVAAIRANKDMLARATALNQVEAADPSVKRYVEYVFWLVVALDLVVLSMKVCHLLATGCAYEEAASALRSQESVETHRLVEEAKVAKQRISDEARAAEEVNKIRAQVDADRLIAEEEAKWSEWATHHRPRREAVTARPLGEHAKGISSQESRPVDVPRGLRLAGWIGTGLVAGSACLLGAYSWTTGRLLTGEWIAMLAFLVVAGLAAYTHGFRSAPPWALRATFAALLGGLLLPFVLFVVNL